MMFFGKLYRAIRYMTPQQIKEGSKIPPPPPPPPATKGAKAVKLSAVSITAVRLEYSDGSELVYNKPKNMRLEIDL